MSDDHKHKMLLIASLQSELCPACGGKKKSGMTLCYSDYKSLSAIQQKALYKRVGQGYEQAFHEAMITLEVETPAFPTASEAALR